MKTMYVYILQCSDGSYYTGVTNNLERRLEEHQQGTIEGCYTISRRPLKLVWSEIFDGPNAAIKFEKQIKGWSRAKKEALISGNLDLLPGLARKKNFSTK